MLDDKVLPVEHLDLCFVLPLLKLGKQVAHFFKYSVFLQDDVVLLLSELCCLLTTRLEHALLRCVGCRRSGRSSKGTSSLTYQHLLSWPCRYKVLADALGVGVEAGEAHVGLNLMTSTFVAQRVQILF